jgi:hypothetical protein
VTHLQHRSHDDIEAGDKGEGPQRPQHSEDADGRHVAHGREQTQVAHNHHHEVQVVPLHNDVTTVGSNVEQTRLGVKVSARRSSTGHTRT